MVWDCDAVLEELPILEYTGPPKAELFIAWAQSHLAAEVQRIRFVTEAATDHRAVLRAAVWKASQSWTEDNGYDTDDLQSEILELIWRRSGNLSKPGSAKLGTRLYALARRHTLNATKKRNRRHSLATARAGEIAGCEIAPPFDEVRANA